MPNAALANAVSGGGASKINSTSLGPAFSLCRRAGMGDLTLILLKKYRDTNGRRIEIQIGDVYTTFCQGEGTLLQKYGEEMGGVWRYFSKVSGSGVHVTLLNIDQKIQTLRWRLAKVAFDTVQ